MKRMGRRHRPFYRINAMETRSPRDGRVLEELGYYDPLAKDESKQLELKALGSLTFTALFLKFCI